MALDDPLTRGVDAAMRRIGISGAAAAILMIVFGILVLAFPWLVSTLIGLYLVVVGTLQLLTHLEVQRGAASPPPNAPPAAPPPAGP